MSLYDIVIKPFVKHLDISKASRIALRYFKFAGKLPGGRFISRLIHNNKPSGLQREVFGLNFYNPVGLGSGLDLHGELYNDLNGLGFSFVEIGPLSLNGIRQAVRNIQKDTPNDIIAACINKDYLSAFTLAYDFCDFFVIDLSSDFNTDLLDPLLYARMPELQYKPIVVKIPDDVAQSELDEFIDFCMLNNIDGVESSHKDQLKHIFEHSGGRIPIIANYHISTAKEALEALNLGASLIEVRSGLVRQGPSFVRKILKILLSNEKSDTK